MSFSHSMTAQKYSLTGQTDLLDPGFLKISLNPNNGQVHILVQLPLALCELPAPASQAPLL